MTAADKAYLLLIFDNAERVLTSAAPNGAVDLLTTIFAPLVMQAIRGNGQGKNKNRVAAFKPYLQG
jgi:hypothetical protein